MKTNIKNISQLQSRSSEIARRTGDLLQHGFFIDTRWMKFNDLFTGSDTDLFGAGYNLPGCFSRKGFFLCIGFLSY